MKSIIILYECKTDYSQEKVFGGKSAVEKTAEWATCVCSQVIKIGECESVHNLLLKMAEIADEKDADYVIFSYDDVPFMNVPLTKTLEDWHTKYHAEYTFADGYPAGFAPEIIDAHALKIMAQLAGSAQKEAGAKKVSRTCIYDFLKTDINSFEVETFIAEHDWRLLRLAFNAGTKSDFLSCVALYNITLQKKLELSDISPDALAEIASDSLEVLKTVPRFYEIQVCDDVLSPGIYSPISAPSFAGKLAQKTASKMSLENFGVLIKSAYDLSREAVVSLSVWSEPLCHSDFLSMAQQVLSYKDMSLFIETSGLCVTEEFCSELKRILEKSPENRNNPYPKLMIAVCLDAFTGEGYRKVHENADETTFKRALEATELLARNFPGSVFPQFVRMNENEDELERFFRFWNEKSGPSGGNLLVQKYNDFAGLLPPRKPADLSPLERFPCWHLRRDMSILPNGDVLPCHSCILSEPVGNVFSEPLEEVWHKNDAVLQEHIHSALNENCRKCDEFYTFNF